MPRFLCTLALSALAVNTLAVSIHHKHSHQHAKKDVDFNDPSLYKDVDWDAVFGKTETAAAAASPVAEVEAAVSSVAAAVVEPSSDDTSDSSSGDSDSFGGQTAAIANGNVDQYIGNVGIPYGSNIIKVSADKADSFTYTNKFVNAGSDSIKIIVWNKSGPDGRPNSGQFSTPALTFNLGGGQSQYVAFDTNSQVAFCHDTGKKTQWGANDCTFGEADFGNESNGGWSGYDVSSIQNSDGNSETLSISSTAGATSSNLGNNYVSDTQAGGIGGNLAPGNVRLTTTFG